MRTSDLLSGLFFLVLGIVFTVFAIRYGLVVDGIPGPGLFPFVVGAALILLSSILFIGNQSYRGQADEGERMQKAPDRKSWSNPILVLVALCGYMLALKHVGFVVTTFLFMLFLLRAVEPQKWRTSLSVSLLTAVLSYVLFHVWLRVEMPKGLLRFITG